MAFEGSPLCFSCCSVTSPRGQQLIDDHNGGDLNAAMAVGGSTHTYSSSHWIVQVLKETLSSAPDRASASAFMHFLAWLAAQLAHTLKHAGRASPSSQQQPSQQAAMTISGASVPLSADFYFFATLLQLLLDHMQTETPPSSITASDAATMGDTPAILPKQAAAAAAAAAATVPGPKGSFKGLQESHGLPVEWAVAAQGAALLVQPSFCQGCFTIIVHIHKLFGFTLGWSCNAVSFRICLA